MILSINVCLGYKHYETYFLVVVYYKHVHKSICIRLPNRFYEHLASFDGLLIPYVLVDMSVTKGYKLCRPGNSTVLSDIIDILTSIFSYSRHRIFLNTCIFSVLSVVLY